MDVEFNKNDDKMRLLISQMEQRLQKVYLGGGKSRIDKLHEQGKMSARERIDFLLDKNTERVEISAFAGYEMYTEHGGCPGGGVVIVIGYVSGKQCIVVANDATVKAGAWFPIYVRRKLPWKTVYQLFIWLIVPVFIYHYKMRSFLIKNILVAFLETML